MDLSVSDVSVGRLLDRRYRVQAPLARGGMATVYRALDTRLDRQVAVKVMHPELAVDDEFVERFISEARSAARLSHPNVVGVFDQGDDDGAVFLVMEYVEGRTLRDVLRERGALPPAVALSFIEPVLSALSAAHEAGIVHRDVKPENVLVGENGRIKVADFGLARALTDSGANTRGLLLGTVNYISPEQALGEPATPRSDVYSAGVMLYELLTGAPPHTGPTDFVVVRSHIDHDVPRPSDADPAIPSHVDEIVQRSTARDPYRRYATAGDFAEACASVRTALDAPVEGLELRDSAGVSMTEAMSVVNVDLDDQPGNGTWHTTIMPAAPPSARPQPRPGQRAPQRPAAKPRRSNRRHRRAAWVGPLMLVMGLIVAGGIAAGAWWLGEGRYTAVPSVVGMSLDEAQAAADAEGLRWRQGGTEPSERIEAGQVVRTEPESGSRLLRGAYVTFITSSGAERFTVPDLRGKDQDDAVDLLAEQNLVADVDEQYHEQVAEGVVIGQGIDPGRELRAGEEVPVYVSLGREPIEIRDYTGQEAATAEQELGGAGLDVTVREQPRQDVRPGYVISQEPSSGTLYSGDEVVLVVAIETSELPVPEVRGQHIDDAVQILEDLGFTNIEINERRAFFSQRIVVDQRPRPGRDVDPDRRITLTVR